MFTIRKKFKIEYAHQLDSAYSCDCHENIHGHSGIIEVFFQSGYLNENGMVVDFTKIKDKIGNYIKSFDHALILSENFIKRFQELKIHNKKLKIVNYNPTAENMAKDIYDTVKEMTESLFTRSTWLEKVRFHETDTGYAEYYEN